MRTRIVIGLVAFVTGFIGSPNAPNYVGATSGLPLAVLPPED